jgi:hypothetical protein
MRPIGGYFELELSPRAEYHKYAIRLNTGRNAFEYILRSRRFEKIYVPYYLCEAMLEPVKRLGLKTEFYYIDNNLEPAFDYFGMRDKEGLLVVNYFGIKGQFIRTISGKCKNLIVDNSHAFFENPVAGIDAFNSPRKFFGVPDGAYLFTDNKLEETLEKDSSMYRFSHLLGRIERNAEEFYNSFIQNEHTLSDQPIRQMSEITLKLMQSIDYEKVASARKINFLFLHNHLSSKNQLNIVHDDSFIPMVYPFHCDRKSLRDHLIRNKIFVAQYWPDVPSRCKGGIVENRLSFELVSLPIDQRYTQSQMQKILDLILDYV